MVDNTFLLDSTQQRVEFIDRIPPTPDMSVRVVDHIYINRDGVAAQVVEDAHGIYKWDMLSQDQQLLLAPLRWIKDDITQFAEFEKHVIYAFRSFPQPVGLIPEHRMVIRLYTDRICYTMNVVTGVGQPTGYLGGGTTSRKPRAGEDWHRGSDITDGPLTRETWEKIKNDIISYELVQCDDGMQIWGLVPDGDHTQAGAVMMKELDGSYRVRHST